MRHCFIAKLKRPDESCGHGESRAAFFVFSQTYGLPLLTRGRCHEVTREGRTPNCCSEPVPEGGRLRKNREAILRGR